MLIHFFSAESFFHFITRANDHSVSWRARVSLSFSLPGSFFPLLRLRRRDGCCFASSELSDSGFLSRSVRASRGEEKISNLPKKPEWMNSFKISKTNIRIGGLWMASCARKISGLTSSGLGGSIRLSFHWPCIAEKSLLTSGLGEI